MDDKELLESRLKQYKVDETKKERKYGRKIIIVIIAIACFFGGYWCNALLSKNNRVVSDDKFAKLERVYDIMMNDFYYGKDDEELAQRLIDGALEGMAYAGNDIHTQYMVPTSASDFTSSMDGSVTGIGVSIVSIEKFAYVITDVVKDSPADEAGLKPGDCIVSVAGEDTAKLTNDELLAKIKGKEGSEVRIGFKRGDEVFEKVITRKKVAASVFSDLYGNVGVLHITSFAQTTGEEVGKHLQALVKNNCTKLIIDLRNNTGGYLTTCREVGSYFLKPDSVILKEEVRDGSINEITTYAGYPNYEFDKLVILINESSASAAEVLCAALSEQIEATVVGTKSYGKGSVQYPLTFDDGSMIKYTTALWFTPNGNQINKVGITPDVIVEQESAYTTGIPNLEDDAVYEVDSVNAAAKSVQTYLKFLGYDVDRCDEYFSNQSMLALKRYQSEHALEVDGKITKDDCVSLFVEMMRKFYSDKTQYDLQLNKAIELCN